MNNILFLFLVIFTLNLKAQITLTKNDMPSPGDTVLISTISNLVGLNAAATGTAYTWDFTMLTSLQERKDSFVAVNSTPLAYQLFFNNSFTYPENKSTVAIPSEPPTLPSQSPIQLSNVINFYKATNVEYAQTGFGAGINGLPASIRFDPALDMDIQYKFPLAYGNQADSCHSFYELNVPNLTYFSQDRKRKNEVDGWGTLQLPNTTYPSLRVKSTSVISDSIYIAQFGFGFRLPSRTEIEYKWLATGKKEPLLVLVVGPNNSIIRGVFQNEPLPSSLRNTSMSNEFANVFPNPSSSFIKLNMEGQNQIKKVFVLNEIGAIVSEFNNCNEINISQLNNGFYLLKIYTSDGKFNTTRFVKN